MVSLQSKLKLDLQMGFTFQCYTVKLKMAGKLEIILRAGINW